MGLVPAWAWAALSGVAMALAAEPFRVAPLGWAALTPLLVVATRPRVGWRAFGYGFVTGVVFFAINIAWIGKFGLLAWLSLSAFLSLFAGIAALAAQRFRRFPIAPVLAAAAWAGMDWLRGSWPWGGFAWGALGSSQASMPGVRWLAGTVGVTGLTFLCAFVAACIADRIWAGGWAWGSIVLVALTLAGFVAADLSIGKPAAAGKAPQIAVVQARVQRPAQADNDEVVFESLVGQTRSIRGADLVVWPESAVGFNAPVDAWSRAAAVARDIRTPMFVGGIDVRDGEYANEVRYFDSAGRLRGVYRKQHRVPFGEYVPLKSLRSVVPQLSQVSVDMVAGRKTALFDVNDVAVSAPICFESVFARDMRAFARAGAQAHIVVTNDSSYERSWASRQHLAEARMRALELRQYVVQAALSGRTGIASPDGRVDDPGKLFDTGVYRLSVPARAARSLYASTGDAFLALWAGLLAAGWAAHTFMVVWGRAGRLGSRT